METEEQDGVPENSDANDEMKSLTQNLSPETAQHALKLKMAMANASEDELKAILELLSNKPKVVADLDGKPPVETEDNTALGDGNVVGNEQGSHEQLLEASDNNHGGVGDCKESNANEDLSIDTKEQGENKNSDVAEEKPLHEPKEISDTSDNPFDYENKIVATPVEEEKLPELTNEAEEMADHSSVVNAGFMEESVSSSEDEKLPELLPNHADDISSGMEFVDDEDPLERISDGAEIASGTSFGEEKPSTQQASVPQTTETEIIDEKNQNLDEGESSSSDDDDRIVSSSVVTSSESDLSEAAVPSNSVAVQSEEVSADVRNTEVVPGTLLMPASKDDDIAIIEDEASLAEAGEEPAYPVLERMSSLSSTATQTSCENLHLLRDQSFNAFGGLEAQNLGQILSGNDKGSSKLPFYYQPQIVMHDDKPILVLQPVPSSTLAGNSDNFAGVENGAIKSSVPIILPLASPAIDKATKDAIVRQINGAGTFLSNKGDVEEGESHDALQQNGMDGHTQLGIAGHDECINENMVVEEALQASQIGNVESLPEWVPASELDKAFSAAAKVTTESTKDQNPATLSFPRVSLPSTNPFAKDLAAQEYGNGEDSAEILSHFDPPQYSLFGPPTSPSLSQGARPKEVKAYQQPGHDSSATNPFAPDLTPKKKGRRQEQKPADSTEVVIAAEVHTTAGQPTEINRAQRTHRRRLSSESMVTLIETSIADTSVSSFESVGAGEPHRIVEPPKIAQENAPMPQPQQERKQASQATETPKIKVPGKVQPFWIPDCVCFNCSSCNVKFTLFIRKHHCRGCGKIFCNSCCSQLARFPYMDFKIGRVCSACADAIRAASRSKKKEDSSKPSPVQQPAIKGTGVAATPGLPTQKSTAPQTRLQPQGVIVANAQAQRNSATPPLVQAQRPQAGAAVPLNQGLPRQPVQYQPMVWPPKPAVPVQNSATSVPGLQQGTQGAITPAQPGNQYMWVPASAIQQNMPVQHSAMPNPALVPQNQLQQGSKGPIRPAQPANQFMWVPASAVQQNMPIVYVNPVAPSLQGQPTFVRHPQTGQLISQQAPVVLMASQPSSTSRLPITTMQTVVTTTGRSDKGVLPVSNRPPAGTVTTFSVLPQSVGQSAVQSAQRHDAGKVRQPPAGSSIPTNSQRPVVASFPQSVPSQRLSTGLPLTSSLRQTPPSDTTAGFSQRPNTDVSSLQPAVAAFPQSAPSQLPSSGLPPSSSLQKSSPTSVTTAVSSQRLPNAAVSSPDERSQGTSTQAQLPSNGLPLNSTLHQSSPPSRTAASLSQRLPDTAASNYNEQGQSYESLSESQRSKESDESVLVAAEGEAKDLHPPLRRAGRTISWHYRTQGKSKLQEQRKSLARDLRDLPYGITVQASQDLLVHIKKMKLKDGERVIPVWCYQSEGLNKFNHLEVVVMLETKRKEDIFPEEVLRVYRGIFHLATKLDNRFEHGTYLSSNNQFLDGSDDAGFIFVSSEIKPKPLGLREMKAPFLYGILIKRSELSAAMFTPSRLLLRLGNKMNSFPFPLWNSRDRRPINLGVEQQDRFYHTLFAMNKYLKNSVPEALIPGLYVVKEDNKIILQVPNSGQSAIVGLLDRLVKKEDQTATVPLLADIPPYVDNCRIVVVNERGGNTVKSFGNAANKSVVGLSFLLLHLGVDASSPLSFGGELLDDGVLVFFSKSHTQKLRESLAAKTNCYFYLGDKFNIAHFELRWMQDVNYHDIPKPAKDNSQKTTGDQSPATSIVDTPEKEPGAEFYPGVATIDIRYSGYGTEVELLKKVFDDFGKILQVLEDNIKFACTDPLMKHANKMKSGESQELQLRVVLRSSYKKWSVGPSDLPTALIRSLQMALHTVKVPVVFEGELVMSFDVSVVKQ